MQLRELLKCLPLRHAPRTGDIDITAITLDSRKTQEGVVFVAIRGEKHDGHQFLNNACAQGASCVVVQNINLVPEWYWGTVVQVADTRKALDLLSACFYKNPSRSLFCVGVTGTNGKTTTTHLIEHLLRSAGCPTGVIGTIDHHLGEKVWKTQLTTPDAVSLQSRLREFADSGAKALAMEVSSHALAQKRADSVEFDTVVFTSFTRDHLDYHKSMDEYLRAKQRLFSDLLANQKTTTAVLNQDDAVIANTPVFRGARVWRYGSGEQADFRFQVLEESFSGSRFHLKTPLGEAEIFLPMPGRFNIANSVAAIAVAAAKGLSLEHCAQALKGFHGVRGRLESVANSRGIAVFVDYAHTDDALRSVLATLSEIRKNSGRTCRILTVFGCGGDRDPGKRPLMTRAALHFSDLVLVTSDNPRAEDPLRIIKDALSEVPAGESRVVAEVDRRKAIALALAQAAPGDVVLIAGKGHEDYQLIGRDRLPFSDVAVVKEILK